VKAGAEGFDLFLETQFLSFQLSDPHRIGARSACLVLDFAIEGLMPDVKSAETGFDGHGLVTPYESR
jgi:hypothetical protein